MNEVFADPWMYVRRGRVGRRYGRLTDVKCVECNQVYVYFIYKYIGFYIYCISVYINIRYYICKLLCISLQSLVLQEMPN